MALTSFTTTVLEKTYLTADMLLLRLEKPADFNFTPGQFVQVTVPDPEKKIFRSYSLLSIPEDPTLDVCIKIVPGGKASTLFAECAVGDTFDMRGPLGHFQLPKDLLGAHFVATGAGIAPIMSMIRAQLAERPIPLSLLFGMRVPEDICLETELLALSKKHPELSLTYCLSRTTQLDQPWQASGRVTAYLKEMNEGEHLFICGSPEMVKEVRSIYLERGIEKERIHLEIF